MVSRRSTRISSSTVGSPARLPRITLFSAGRHSISRSTTQTLSFSTPIAPTHAIDTQQAPPSSGALQRTTCQPTPTRSRTAAHMSTYPQRAACSPRIAPPAAVGYQLHAADSHNLDALPHPGVSSISSRVAERAALPAIPSSPYTAAPRQHAQRRISVRSFGELKFGRIRCLLASAPVTSASAFVSHPRDAENCFSAGHNPAQNPFPTPDATLPTRSPLHPRSPSRRPTLRRPPALGACPPLVRPLPFPAPRLRRFCLDLRRA